MSKVFFSVTMSLDGFIAPETFQRTGVSIMGKRMCDGGERHWPKEAPFHTPVLVLTRQCVHPGCGRGPLRKGGIFAAPAARTRFAHT